MVLYALKKKERKKESKAAPEHMGNRPGAEQRRYIMAAHVKKFPLLKAAWLL